MKQETRINLIITGVVVLIVALAFVAIGAITEHLEDECVARGGHVKVLKGRDIHVLCLTPDGRIMEDAK